MSNRIIHHKHSVAPVTALIGAAAVFAVIGWAPIPRQTVQAAPIAPALSAADITTAVTAGVKAALPETKPAAPVVKTVVKTVVKRQVVHSAPVVRYIVPVYGCAC